jgi:hypothetical protein
LKNASVYRQGKTTPNEFIQENYNYYRTLTDYDIWMLIRDFAMNHKDELDSANKIAKRIYQRKVHYSFRFEETSVGAVSSIVERIKKDLSLEDWQIFVTENDTTAYEAQDDPILIVDEIQGVHRIQKYSYLLSMLGDKHEKEGYLAIDLDLWDSQSDDLRKRLKKYIPFVESKEPE